MCSRNRRCSTRSPNLSSTHNCSNDNPNNSATRNNLLPDSFLPNSRFNPSLNLSSSLNIKTESRINHYNRNLRKDLKVQ